MTSAGLAARDTLRLEAGLNLYGSDMDEAVTPLECGLAWTIAWQPADRSFVGRQALERQREQGAANERVGLILEEQGVLRHAQKVSTAQGGKGKITSGGYSPTLRRGIALASVPAGTRGVAHVEIRGRPVPARVVKPPFVRFGKPCIDVPC